MCHAEIIFVELSKALERQLEDISSKCTCKNNDKIANRDRSHVIVFLIKALKRRRL